LEEGTIVMWYMGPGWGWWMIVGWVSMLLFWGLVIWAVYMVISRLSRGRDEHSQPQASALDILERRYASGELTSEQFEDMRRRLTDRGANRAA
jgi:putative membrane protein